MKILLKGMSLQEIQNHIITKNFLKYNASQIYEWMYKHCIYDVSEMTNISDKLKQFISDFCISNTLMIKKKTISDNGLISKYLFETTDKKLIESVSMIEDDRHTVCLSSQVGCNVDCDFCATGKMGFIKNLSSGEILDQLIHIKRDMEVPVTNIVFMGMGEPLLNFQNVIKASDIINDSMAFNISHHKITISTAGVLPKIKKFIKEKIKYNLAISLNASNDTVRNKLMPLNNKWPINSLIRIAKEYNKTYRKKILFEYVLIDSVNDNITDAIRLSSLLKNSQCKLNIIPYNEIGNHYRRPNSERIEKFLRTLYQHQDGFNILVRWSKGVKISAGCGQLATEHQ